MNSFKLYLGECTVDYDGRSSSFLDTGERITLVRPNVVTVHALDDRVNPINYMKEANTTITPDPMTITATRADPSESLQINFSRLDKTVEYDGTDKAELALTGTEDELQEELHENAHRIDSAFVSEEREYHTGAGPVDLRGTLDGTQCLVEVKKHADVSAISQLARYLKADDCARGILATISINDSAKQTLTEYDNIEWRKV